MTSLPPKSSKKKLIILLITLIVLAGGTFGLYWSNKTYLDAYYDAYVFKQKIPVKHGDKMYMVNYLVDTSSSKNYNHHNQGLYRLIRPLNGDEIDAMDLTLAEKAVIKNDLSSKKPYMFESKWAISTDTLCKYKSAFVSYYTDCKIANLYMGEGQYLPTLFFEVHPVRRAMIRIDYDDSLPSGYKFDDNYPFFLEPNYLSVTEKKTFRKVE